MSTRRRRVALRAEHVLHDHGHWCSDCRLSTGARYIVAVISPYGMHLQSHLRCLECGGAEVIADEDNAHGCDG